jgi:Right handed beta helix region
MRSARWLMVVLAGLALDLARPVAARADCDFTIASVPVGLNEPGTYCLAGDLVHDQEGIAIWVTAPNVTLDLSGFTLSNTLGPGARTFGIASLPGANGVTVMNGTVAGFHNAVVLLEGSGHLISGVTARGSGYGGLSVNEGSVQDCRVVDTGGSPLPGDTIPIGIRAVGEGISVSDNVVSGMIVPPGGEVVGISIDEGASGLVQRNVVAIAEAQDHTFAVWNLGAIDARDNLIIRFSYGLVFADPGSGTYATNTFFNVGIPVAFGVGVPIDGGGNSFVRSFCEPVYELPYVITEQGSYCLVRNLSTAITSGAAISIETDYVTLDLRGLKVGGGAAGPSSLAVGVRAVDRRNVTVANGNIRGFWKGVLLDDTSPDQTTAQAYRVEGIRADENIDAGIEVRGRASVVRGNQVVATTGTDGGDTAGIRVAGPLSRVRDNEVSDTASAATAYGVLVASSPGSVVERNRVSGAAGAVTTGVGVQGSTDALVMANRVLGAAEGVHFSGSSGKYRDNVTAGVVTPYVGGTDAGNNN